MAKKNKTQRQAELGEKFRGIAEVKEELIRKGRPELAAELELPEEVTVIEMTPENVGKVHNAIAEAVGEPSVKLVETYERELAEEVNELGLEGSEEAVEKEPVSIVKNKFKVRYAENAALIGDTRKQVKRSNWDWLAQQLAVFCLNDKGKIDIGSFQDVLEANGIDHAKWANRTKGWEGRFRMTGRVALQKVVANNGALKWPDNSVSEAPAEFCEKYKTK